MYNLFTYLLELNIGLIILYLAFKIFFERDKNFVIRRIYLMGVIVLPFLLPLIPEGIRIPVSQMAPISIGLEGVTIFDSGTARETRSSFSPGNLALIIYLMILALGLIKLFIQLGSILRAISMSTKMEVSGTTLHANPDLHASSFFKFIFIDPDAVKEESIQHILEHENIHKREWHSIDRILVELFVMINWFNPLAWMFRKSVIQNLEYLADSAVLRKGCDPMKYQLSILNQYIGSASISNQFSSQIKNRINMLNKNYKLGSSWKLILIFPLVFIAFFIVSCTENDNATLSEDSKITNSQDDLANERVVADQKPSSEIDGELFFIVEEMPTFQGQDPATAFRKYIAQNLIYPKEAIEKGVTGKIFIRFVVNSSGKVIVPEPGFLAEVEDKSIGEVVVAAYRTLEKDQEMPEQKYIDMLKDEVIRVVSSSPDWEPGQQNGKEVNVLFTFPVTFTLQ